jgi:serine protease Do
MKHTYFLRSFIALLALCSIAQAQDRPEAKIFQQARLAVFEVVINKPSENQLKYDKIPPTDNIPFRYKNDSVMSIGSAFAVGVDTLVSASHVLIDGMSPLYGNPRIRSMDGKVYQVKQILKHSLHRDFVMFTVKGLKVTKPLKTTTQVPLNETVYSVGNSLGEGIIVRDGLLTSTTAEEIRGEWKWLRFSAAASPGNSGGPLVDRTGRVIGVILRKSENENLNYALPWDEIAKAPKESHLYSKVKYGLTQLQGLELPRTIDQKFPLPLSLGELNKAHNQFWRQDYQEGIQKLIDSNQAIIFPQGKTSLVTRTPLSSYAPSTLIMTKDSIWSNSDQSEEDQFFGKIDSTGWLRTGRIGNFLSMHLHAPDSVPFARIIADPILNGELLTNGLKLERDFFGTTLRIISLGKPSIDSTTSDIHGRKWLVRHWEIPHENQVFMTYQLPTPDGMILFAIFVNANQGPTFYPIDFKYFIDHATPQYYGTFAQWKRYLAQKEWLPTELKDMEFDGSKLKVGRVHMNLPTLFPLDSLSDLELRQSRTTDPKAPQPIITSAIIGENKHKSDRYQVSVYNAPAIYESKDAHLEWKNMSKGRSPCNESPSTEEDLVSISGCISTAKDPQTDLPTEQWYYVVVRSLDDSKRIKKEFETLRKNLLFKK